jgi:hypothetical protein
MSCLADFHKKRRALDQLMISSVAKKMGTLVMVN